MHVQDMQFISFHGENYNAMAIMNIDPETNAENLKQIDCLKLAVYLNINSVSIAWAFIVQTVYKQVSY